MRTATVYRLTAKEVVDECEKINYDESGEPQFEMCIFTDGRVAQRWMVGKGSCVWWDSLEDLYRVHIYAHPDYGTKVVWSDGEVENL